MHLCMFAYVYVNAYTSIRMCFVSTPSCVCFVHAVVLRASTLLLLSPPTLAWCAERADGMGE